jgi:hypothetical protein
MRTLHRNAVAAVASGAMVAWSVPGFAQSHTVRLRDAPDTVLADVHDRTTGTTTLVSRNRRGAAANGASTNPAIAGDGRFVAFQSDASDLVCTRGCNALEEDIRSHHRQDSARHRLHLPPPDRARRRERRLRSVRGGGTGDQEIAFLTLPIS